MDATTGSSDVGERLALLLFFSNEAGNLAVRTAPTGG
jgi:hypothetical protein